MTEVEVVRHGVIRPTFADGLTGEIEVLDRMWGPVFARARTPEGFREAFLDDEGATSAWSPDVLGCVATGNTVDECVTQMREALAFHLAVMKEDGETPPEPTGPGVYVERSAVPAE